MNDPWSHAAVGVLWVIAALTVASGAFAALLHMLAGLQAWPGVPALAIILAAACAVLSWRLLFDRGRHS